MFTLIPISFLTSSSSFSLSVLGKKYKFLLKINNLTQFQFIYFILYYKFLFYFLHYKYCFLFQNIHSWVQIKYSRIRASHCSTAFFSALSISAWKFQKKEDHQRDLWDSKPDGVCMGNTLDGGRAWSLGMDTLVICTCVWIWTLFFLFTKEDFCLYG